MAHAISAGLNRTYTAAAGRKFAFTVAAAFLVFSAIARFRGHAVSPVVLATIAAVLAVAGTLVPAKLGPVDRAWMALAKAIAKVTTPVFMGVLYFVVVTPIALLRRALGGNGLVHRSGQVGYWVDRTESPRSAMGRQF
ncbi:MAG TPA: SxtJ family membrane protein [Gemmatimonadaceae bacterium]|nr:SxtJ family membrane protein [Gemmatimonadaceae bacterium]